MESINSFITLAEKITLLNKNCVEILTKVNDIVSSENDSVTIVYDDNGAINSFSQPTVGYFKNQIDILNQNMKRMASIDGYTFVRDGQSFKRIMTSDLNREPSPIQDINQVTTFTPINNHFFESLMNPMLAVTIDLTNKVEQIVNKIVSRRYIIRFTKNEDGSLTEAGLRSFNSFSTSFLNKTQINISDFISWYDNPSNDGLVVDTIQPYDEQIYDMALKSLQYHGVFSVIKVEVDDINNKMWYHLNDTRYYGNDGSIKKLAIGDELIVNKLNAGTRYKIVEVNTDSSNLKIRVENIEGYDPIIVGTNVLKYYSDISTNKTVRINVGFDEYIVLFVKPINTDDNIVGNLWSKGISFYTNDLILDINNNINLSQYYVQAVYDYGVLLRDMINKNIPTIYGVTPNPVVLTSENFKVVQINKHLTDEKDQTALLKSHSDKITVKTQISQLNTAIQQKTSRLNAGGLTTTEKQTYLNEINKLKTDLKISTENLSSLITQITELNTGTNVKVEPKYRVRGFWTMPEPIISDKTQPQHVIQFRIQYRYSSRSGNSNNIQTFNYINVQQQSTSQVKAANTGTRIKVDTRTNTITGGGAALAATASSTPSNQASSTLTNGGAPPRINVGKVAPIASSDVVTTTENPPTAPKYANFSNWVELMSDVRKRHWDDNSKQWYWKIEDVSDAETPNINQVDIPIQQNERVEIRIKAISEVGWPDSLIESDWSNVLTIDFPDDLNNILSDNLFILTEASQDKTSVVLESTLNSKGVDKHMEDSFTVNQDYVAHKDTSIQVSIKTEQSMNMNLFQYLTYLTNRIASLEQQLITSKGTLNILLYKNTTLLKTITNNSTTIINIECEDYGTSITGTGRTYVNAVNVIEDYIISFMNTNQSGNLGFLSNRTYTTGGTNAFYSENGLSNKVLLVDYNNNLYTQNNNQFIWFADRDNNDWVSSGATMGNAPYILNANSYNFGTTGSSTVNSPWWNVNDIFSKAVNTDLLCAVFPYLPDINNFIENGQDKTKIIKPQTKFNIGLKIFFKFDGDKDTSTPSLPIYYTPGSGTIQTNTTKTRKIKFWFETNDNVNYQFVINFNFKRYRSFLKPKTGGFTSGDYNSGISDMV
jgi:hypothetical protein